MESGMNKQETPFGLPIAPRQPAQHTAPRTAHSPPGAAVSAEEIVSSLLGAPKSFWRPGS
jgi:hypothetical protein